ncbi:MAG: ComEC/Rec2 family competence protein [Pseudomonadota bacterium]
MALIDDGDQIGSAGWWSDMITAAQDLMDAQRGSLFHWVPVCLGVGIGGYFALPADPDAQVWWGLGGLSLAGLVAGLWIRQRAAVLLLALSLVLIGAAVAAWKAHQVAAPVLGFRYYGPIEGRLVAVDRSLSDRLRLTLDKVVLANVSPDRTPARVRVSVHTKGPEPRFPPGSVLILTGHLSPPEGPAEPGGFDFRRHAWFKGIGGVGYTRTPVLRLAPPEEHRIGVLITAMRMHISGAVRAAIPGEAGGFAAAILTGDRSGVDRQTLDNLRESNLAHLLAISGLHMGLLTGFVFGLARVGLALIPYVALRWPTKKIAAVIALAAGAFYLALSGGNVATERAFVMVAVMLAAILLDRRAITLRAVAVAATIILLWQPESLVSPGFQMSFAATTALVAVFAGLRETEGYRLPKWAQPVMALVLSSGIAGLATAPIGAAHFNQIAQYGLIANLLSVPLMGSVVIPAAVFAAVLSPFGLGWIGLEVMRLGTAWILGVAEVVASLDGAVTKVPSPGPAVLPLITLGALFVILWQGRSRWVGVFPVVAGFLVWSLTERPLILISSSGGMLGVMTAEGRVLSKSTGNGFVARSWLENDGDRALQEEAAGRAGFEGPKGYATYRAGGLVLVHLAGKTGARYLSEACSDGAWVIMSEPPDQPTTDCRVFAPHLLEDTGSIAFKGGWNDLRKVTAQEISGDRLWSRQSGER